MPALLLDTNSSAFIIIGANGAYCQLTSKAPEQFIGQPIANIFQDTPLARMADLDSSLRTASETGLPQTLHFEPQFSNESRSWEIIHTPVKDSVSGKITCILHSIANMHDTQPSTVQYHAADEQQESTYTAIQDSAKEILSDTEESGYLLQAILNAAQAGIFLLTPVYDESGTITDFRFRIANKRLAAYVGQTAETMSGALGSEWFPAYKSNGLFEWYCDTALTGRTNRFEFHYNADGIDVWLDIMSTKVADDVLVTTTDHTSLKNLQRRLEEHVEELRSSNANLEQFAYIASHDLQEPLRKVKSFGDMLQGRFEEKLGKEGVDLIIRMQNAASRMGILIEDLLTYSRVSVKPVVMQVMQTDKVLDGVLFDLERLIQQQGALIQADKLAPVAGQATQIGQLFQNLLSNALKFHQPSRKPEIRITSTMLAGRDAGMSIAKSDDEKPFQLIRIQDNGIGFDNVYRERIFQIFQRLHNRTEYPGTGVGLSIVKKVVENHNGYIEADAVSGEGATFSILLPAVTEA